MTFNHLACDRQSHLVGFSSPPAAERWDVQEADEESIYARPDRRFRTQEEKGQKSDRKELQKHHLLLLAAAAQAVVVKQHGRESPRY